MPSPRNALSALALLAAALSGCGAEPPAAGGRPPDARSVARGVVTATLRYEGRSIDTQEGAPTAAAGVRSAAGRCLPDWRAAPYRRRAALLDFYATAVARPAFAAERRAARAWITELRDVLGAEGFPVIAGGSRALSTDLARLSAVLAEPVDACRVVRAWRRADWRARPATLRRLDRLKAAAGRTEKANVGSRERTGRFVRRYGGSDGAEAKISFSLGIQLPDGFDRCMDPVFDFLAPEDTFCG